MEEIEEPLTPKPFVCKRCIEIIERPEHFSKEFELCINCYNEKQAIENNKCLGCGGKNPKKEYWGSCKKCFHKPVKEKDFQESMKLDKIEREQGWEAAQEYLEKG